MSVHSITLHREELEKWFSAPDLSISVLAFLPSSGTFRPLDREGTPEQQFVIDEYFILYADMPKQQPRPMPQQAPPISPEDLQRIIQSKR